MTNIGFVGLGKMGGAIAAHLQAADHSLVVTDADADAAKPLLAAGARWASTPVQVAEACDMVFTCLPTPDIVRTVGFGDNGLVKGLREGTLWVELSTNSLEHVREFHAGAAKYGIDFLDAPVSGGPDGARAGKLAVWIGGAQAAVDRARPVIAAFAPEIFHLGDTGAGTIAKLVHNLAGNAINSVVVEALTMGVRAGVDPFALWSAIRTGVVGKTRSFDNISKRFLRGRVDEPNFPLRLLQKDISLALQLGREVNVPMRICNLVAQDIAEAINRGWGNRDSQSMLLLQQERAGVPPFHFPDSDVDAVLKS